MRDARRPPGKFAESRVSVSVFARRDRANLGNYETIGGATCGQVLSGKYWWWRPSRANSSPVNNSLIPPEKQGFRHESKERGALQQEICAITQGVTTIFPNRISRYFYRRTARNSHGTRQSCGSGHPAVPFGELVRTIGQSTDASRRHPRPTCCFAMHPRRGSA